MWTRDTSQLIYIWASLAIWVAEGQVTGSIGGLCTTDSECSAAGTYCGSGVCVCNTGFTSLNGQCSQVFGRVCLDNTDCDDGRTFCANSRCACKAYKWREENGVCVSYYGSSCNDGSDCGHSYSFFCENNACRCQNGYKFADGNCEKVINSKCMKSNGNGDCPLDHSVCKTNTRSWDLDNDECRCEYGFDESNNICVQVLGSSCADVGCGNTLHYSYRYIDPSYKSEFQNLDTNDYWWWWEENYWYEWNHYYHLHLSCDINNICNCDCGFRPGENGTFCEPAHGGYCESSEDCGSYHGYMCDSTILECICAPNYVAYDQRWESIASNENLYDYTYSSNDVTLCRAELGQACSIVTCSVNNAYCDDNDTCSCIDGYTEYNDGSCIQVLGTSCVRETFCQIVDGGTCGVENTCTCKDGFEQNDQLCEPVLRSNCMSNVDCDLDNAICDQGICVCDPGFSEGMGRCLSAAYIDVPDMPDMRKRGWTYKLAIGEQPIDDKRLNQKWYSIGKHSIHYSPEPPEAGSCGTIYPLYLKEPLTQSQLDEMLDGEVTVTASVGGTDIYGLQEQVDIRMRKVGTDTHLYLYPVPIHFTGLCLDNGNNLDISKSAVFMATVVSDLLFRNELTDTGEIKHSPYLVFSCLPTEFITRTVIWKYPYESFVVDDDIYFYYVHWYINGVHFNSFGPLKRTHFINGSSIFEKAIVDAGFVLGFKIRCSFEVSETPNGLETLLVNSNDLYTGVQTSYAAINEGMNTYLLQPHFNIPLGCETVGEYGGDQTCSLFWPVVGEDGEVLCESQHSVKNQHLLCRVSVRGYTQKIYQDLYTNWRLNQHVNYMYEHNYTTMEDGFSYYFWNSTTEHLGVNISITGADETTSTMKVKLGPTENDAGHAIWTGYTMPDINFNIIGKSFTKETCKVIMLNYPVLSKEVDWDSTFSREHVLIDTIGEFTMYYSTEKPVQVQIQTEDCSWANGGVCICAVNYRDGNNTYIYSYCNGLTIIGQTNGEPSSSDIDNVQLMNGIQLNIISYNGNIKNVTLSTNHSKATLEDGEGLCMFTDGSYKHGNGSKTADSNGFVTSWSVSLDDSLLNPRNHEGVSWTDEYVHCGCPDQTEVLNDREIIHHENYTYTSDTYIDESYYTTLISYQGFIRCAADNVCRVNNTGDNAWTSSLLPEPSITAVTARMEIHYVDDLPLLHLYCEFDGQDGLFYSITWKIGDDEVYQSSTMSYLDASYHFITNENIQTEEYLLEAKFSCAASVLGTSGDVLGTAYSNTICAVEIVQTEIPLQRGRDIEVPIQLNIPLACVTGESCYFDFKLFNPSDSNDCRDSSVVVKGRNTCGKRIVGANSETALVNSPYFFNITLTTKNNNLYVLRDTFQLRMKLNVNGHTSGFMLGLLVQEIMIFVRDDEKYWQRNYCYANNDPRMRTFDGQYFNHMVVGVYSLVIHTRLQVEIQLETAYCGRWGGVCACGITVRAGRDVFTVNHCHGEHITNYLLSDDGTLNIRRRNAHRYQTCTTVVQRSPDIARSLTENESKHWERGKRMIYLPHGTMVDVRVSRFNSFMVNAFIYPSPADMKNVEGLCGNFDGNWQNELRHSDGTFTSSDRYYWWWYTPDPDNFIESWNVNVTNRIDLTDQDEINERLDSWYADDLFCVCTGSDGDGEIRCSANEDDTCSGQVDKPGTLVSVTARNKRSTSTLSNDYRKRLAKMREKRAAHAMESKLDPDKEWASLTCEALEANIEQEVRQDIELQESKPEIFEKWKKRCSGNCSNNGVCVNGICQCNDGYGEDDCSIGLSDTVTADTGDILCDRKQDVCSCIHVSTSGSVPTSKFTAEHRKATVTGTWDKLETISGSVQYLNTYEVYVCPDEYRRWKRSTDGNAYIADQYIISLSNDGSTFGSGSPVYILDSTCLQINQTSDPAKVELLTGYCIISGICYLSNTSSPGDTCKFCNDTASPYEWTKDNEKDGCTNTATEEGDDDLDVFQLTLIFGSLAVVGIVVTIIAVIIMIKKKRPRISPEAVSDLYEMPKNVKFRLRRESWT